LGPDSTRLPIASRSHGWARNTATLFPLTFGANAYVSVHDLPGVLQTAAAWNPLSAVITACGQLFGNPTGLPADPAWPLAHPVVASVLWCVGIVAVCLPLAVRR
jgi:ABC-2 type transport system permease protein